MSIACALKSSAFIEHGGFHAFPRDHQQREREHAGRMPPRPVFTDEADSRPSMSLFI